MIGWRARSRRKGRVLPSWRGRLRLFGVLLAEPLPDLAIGSARGLHHGAKASGQPGGAIMGDGHAQADAGIRR